MTVWLELDGAVNGRDIGGLPAAGGRTRAGVLLRCDALDALSGADVSYLVHSIGLSHVVDLRSAGERAERGRGRLGDTAVRYTKLAVIDDDVLARRRDARAAAFAAGEDPVRIIADGYVELLELGASGFVSVLEAIVEPEGAPVLVHCSAGKDRTGVLVALLLDAAGVDRDAIVADYAATAERLPALRARLERARAFQEVAAEIPAFVLDARPETMRLFLESLDQRHGGPSAFLRAHGAGDDLLDAWREMLIEP